MSDAEPLRHGPVIERLWRAARDGRLPHALLFEGGEGTGKFLAATWFARGLMCAAGPAPPCEECGPCKRTQTGMHADLHVIDAEADGEERILLARIARRAQDKRGADPVESIEAFLDLRPLESDWRLVLIRESHRMNHSAQNALLKTLEEPRPGNILVLETHRAARHLPTILSRCVRVRFDPLSAEECEGVLTGTGLDPALAMQLARWSQGSPGVALAWHGWGVIELLSLIGRVLEGQPALRVAPELWEVEGDFPGKTPTARARERARLVLDLALVITRDGLRCVAGVSPETLPMGELAVRLAPGGERSLRHLLEALLEARADVDRNLTPEAVLERGLLALAGAVPILDRASSPAALTERSP